MKVISVISLLLILTSCLVDSKKKQAEEVIDKIYTFKELNSRYPTSLNEIGIKETEEGPIYYELKDSTSFVIWYGKGIGESAVYSSNTKEWEK